MTENGEKGEREGVTRSERMVERRSEKEKEKKS